jgi:hypothetical protein
LSTALDKKQKPKQENQIFSFSGENEKDIINIIEESKEFSTKLIK